MICCEISPSSLDSGKKVVLNHNIRKTIKLSEKASS